MIRKSKGKRFLCLIITVIIFVGTFPGMTGFVRADRLDDVKKQNEEDKNELDNISEEIDEMQNEQQGITSEMDELSEEIAEMMASISIIEADIEQKKSEIATATRELEEAVLTEKNQYDAMRVRLHFLYESGEMTLLDALMSASSISDALNRADYIEKLYSFDKEMLEEYKQTRAHIEELKEQLEIEESELEEAQAECEEEKLAMEQSFKELEEISADYDLQISKAKQQAEVYKQKIKKQNQEIARLEEEKRRAQEAANNRKPGTAKVNKEEILDAKGSDLGKQIAIYACSFVGNPYVWGGTSLTNGTDCSGFTQSIYKNYGYKIPRTSLQQRSAGKEVSYADAQPGDLICYAGHVAMYIGNGKIVHARSKNLGIRIDYANYKSIICVRRII